MLVTSFQQDFLWSSLFSFFFLITLIHLFMVYNIYDLMSSGLLSILCSSIYLVSFSNFSSTLRFSIYKTLILSAGLLDPSCFGWLVKLSAVVTIANFFLWLHCTRIIVHCMPVAGVLVCCLGCELGEDIVLFIHDNLCTWWSVCICLHKLTPFCLLRKLTAFCSQFLLFGEIRENLDCILS